MICFWTFAVTWRYMHLEGIDMYSLKIVDGDLAMLGDGTISKVSGADRIRQDLSCWILEPLGTDVMYPNFGSTLGNDIGAPIVADNLLEIKAEVTRVVNNYIEYQKKQYEDAKLRSTEAVVNAWTPGDMIAKVNGIHVDSVADTVTVVVKLTTAAGEGISIEQVL